LSLAENVERKEESREIGLRKKEAKRYRERERERGIRKEERRRRRRRRRGIYFMVLF
jgi:hypothetical protein